MSLQRNDARIGSTIKSRSQAAAEAATGDTRETLARRVQNVPATASCTRSPLKKIMETAPTSISAQRKAAGHVGMKAPLNMGNSLTLAELACQHKSKKNLATLCSGAHGEKRPKPDFKTITDFRSDNRAAFKKVFRVNGAIASFRERPLMAQIERSGSRPIFPLIWPRPSRGRAGSLVSASLGQSTCVERSYLSEHVALGLLHCSQNKVAYPRAHSLSRKRAC